MDFLTAEFLGWPIWLWLSFLTVVVALLAFDLGVLHRKDHVVSVQESLAMTGLYLAIGLGFAVAIFWIYTGAQPAGVYDQQLAIAGSGRGMGTETAMKDTPLYEVFFRNVQQALDARPTAAPVK